MSEDFKWTDELVKEYVHRTFAPCDPNHPFMQDRMTEFKKSKVEKDYEILYFKNNLGVIIPSTNSLVKLYSYPIYSVKRLSDNEVFTIKDKVSSTWGTQVITGFIIANDNTITVEFATCRNPLSKIKKFKEPLFTTDDGKEIFEGDTYWYVGKKTLCIGHSNLTINHSNIAGYINDYFYFYTEEKAKEYVLMNKPITLTVGKLADELSNWCWGKDIPSEITKLKPFLLRGLGEIINRKKSN